MERDEFLQQTGLTNEQFAGLNLLKLLSYDPAATSALQSNQSLNTGAFITSFAQSVGGRVSTTTSRYDINMSVESGFLAGAQAIANWKFLDHRTLASGVSVLTVKDASGKVLGTGDTYLPLLAHCLCDVAASALVTRG
ncbi:MAG: hypothetical protein AB7G04_09865 [Hyphomonadaceae bacterium]